MEQPSKCCRMEERSKAAHDPLFQTSRVIWENIASCHLNCSKVVKLRTILEEQRVSMDGVIDKCPEVWETMGFHGFQHFTTP